MLRVTLGLLLMHSRGKTICLTMSWAVCDCFLGTGVFFFSKQCVLLLCGHQQLGVIIVKNKDYHLEVCKERYIYELLERCLPLGVPLGVSLETVTRRVHCALVTGLCSQDTCSRWLGSSRGQSSFTFSLTLYC